MSETEQEMISSVLSFLAENVNLYNWHLLRSPNPNRYMYDETEESMHKLYYKLFERAEENNEISIKLKNTVLKLCLTDDEEEDNNCCARLLATFIQNRQREIHFHNRHPESERGLWLLYDSYYTNDFYSKLYKLERIYMDILLHDDTELRKMSYNHIVEAEDNLPQYRIGPPELGESELELEKVYLSDHMGYEEDRYLRDYEEDLRDYEEERYYDEIDRDRRYYEEERYYEEHEDYQENTPALKIVDTNIILEFDCPICFEEQTSGSQCATTTCEHQYCAPCFESMTQYKRVCAMCRGKISEYIVSIVA